MDDYLAKPLRLERLTAVCERWLRSPGRGVAPPAASARETPGLFDPSVLAQFATPEQTVGLLAMFVTQLREGMAELDQAHDAAVLHDVARTSHRLKGSAATIGAVAMADIMDSVCRDARLGGASLAALHARAQAVVAATIDALEAHLDGAASASATAAATLR